jgi:hypothetical protein
MYSLGIPQGCSLGRDLVIFFRAQTGRTILSPAVPATTYVAQTAYVSFGRVGRSLSSY